MHDGPNGFFRSFFYLHGVTELDLVTYVSITEAPVRGGVGNPPGLTQPPTGPGWARPRDSLTPSHAPGYSLTPPPGDHSRRRRRRAGGGGGGRMGGGMGSGMAVTCSGSRLWREA